MIPARHAWEASNEQISVEGMIKRKFHVPYPDTERANAGRVSRIGNAAVSGPDVIITWPTNVPAMKISRHLHHQQLQTWDVLKILGLGGYYRELPLEAARQSRTRP